MEEGSALVADAREEEEDSDDWELETSVIVLTGVDEDSPATVVGLLLSVVVSTGLVDAGAWVVDVEGASEVDEAGMGEGVEVLVTTTVVGVELSVTMLVVEDTSVGDAVGVGSAVELAVLV